MNKKIKKCSNCRLSVDDGIIFGKNKKNKDGLSYRCKECKRKLRKKYYHSEKGTETRKEYEQSGKNKEVHKKYWQSKEGKETHKKYRQSKKGKEASRRGYMKNKLSNNLSVVIRKSLKGNKNGHHWEDLTGWTLQQFKRRFVQLFKTGMTWENHGTVWEIDHIQPVSAHNITSIDCTDFKRAWALSNLQPLFKEENRSKSNNLEKPFQPTLF